MYTDEVNVEGFVTKEGHVLMGTAKRQPDGTWRCLANVGGALCLVQVTVKFDPRMLIGEARRVEAEP